MAPSPLPSLNVFAVPPTYERNANDLSLSGDGKAATDEGAAAKTSVSHPQLSDEQISVLRPYGEVEETRAGDVLFAEGDPAYDFFVTSTAASRSSPARTAKSASSPWADRASSSARSGCSRGSRCS